MLEGKRISELDTVNNLQNGCCFPVLSKGATKRITFASLLSEIENKLPQTDVEEIKQDVEELKVKSEKIDTLEVDVTNVKEDVANVKEEVAGVDEMVEGQNAAIRNCQATVNDIERTIEQTHFDDVLELEEQVRVNTQNINNKLDKTTSAENAGKIVKVDEDGNLIFDDENNITIDDELDTSSENAVQNKVIAELIPTEASAENKLATENELDNKQDALNAAQTEAVNSGITAALVAQIGQGGASEPAGIMKMFAGSNAPAGYLICDGRTISRTEYAALFAAIGTTWGSGDGSTTFNIPDMREAVPVGVGQSSRNGITTHDTYTLGQFKDDQMQGHKHNDSGHSHTDSGHTHTDAGHEHALKDMLWSDQQWIAGMTTHNDWHLNGNATGAGSSKTYGAQANIQSSNANIQPSNANITTPVNDGTNGTPRTGTTTHGKQVGVNYIIKY